MLLNDTIWLGTSPEGAVSLLPAMANRHGLIAGATGTGKTVSLQVLAEGFSKLGVPVFLADNKGEMSGLCKPAETTEAIAERLTACGAQDVYTPAANPVVFWDVYGQKGHPIRTTVSEMGPLLFSRLLQLNDTQSGVIHLLFRIADDEGLLLIDLKDVKAMLSYVGENTARYTLDYGNITRASVGAIQRAIAILESQGGDVFFGEPALDIADWIAQDENGRGVINVLSGDLLYNKPVMYSTFLLWMLSELNACLPEQGDAALPRMVFFFDEAHLLFKDCSKSLLERIEQTVRMIRSKGVGVYMVTQAPADIPSSVLAQLSNKVQHAMRAFTPREQKTLHAVAQTMRPNPAFDTEEALQTLRTGEALLSFLQEDGSPSVTQRATILPPQSAIGTIDDALRQVFIETDALGDKYDHPFDRESAYEMLSARMTRAGAAATRVVQPVPTAQDASAPLQTAPQAQPAAPMTFRVFNPATGQYEELPLPTMQQPVQAQPVQPTQPVYSPAQSATVLPESAAQAQTVEAKQSPSGRKTGKKEEKGFGEQLLESFARSATTSAGRTVGSSLTRSLLGTLGLNKRGK